MPCRDVDRYLPAAMESLSLQTFQDHEVLAVDDGSGDATPDLLRDWARRDPRVRVLPSQGRGLVPALSTGVAAARGPLLARMDADDVAEPERLARQVELMSRHPDVAACATGVRYFPAALVRHGARRYEEWINGVVTPDDIRRDIFIECPLPHPTLVIRRQAMLAVGGYRDRGWPEDYDLVLRLWAHGHAMAKVPDILYRWRERPDRASRVDPRYGPDRFRAIKVHFLRRTLLAGGRPAVIWGAGPIGKAFARALARAGTPVAAFVDLAPGRVGQDIHGAPVVRPERAGEFAGPGSATGALILAAVGQPHARQEIRDACRGLGLVEGQDYVAVA
jgi:glycosyltransferase involved in cell wall biosynthesis